MKTRILALLLATIMLVGAFSGCTAKPAEPSSSPESSATPVAENKVKLETPEEVIGRMNEIISDKEHPLAAAALGVIKDGKLIFADAVGNAVIDNENPKNNVGANADTKYRIASISKLVTAIGAWQLIEQGKIDIKADAGDYLGFKLRNPAYPDTAITIEMLMSHTSSIREGGDNSGLYSVPLGHNISEFFEEGSECYCDGCWAPSEEKPGEFFSYANMNYCLLATIIEKVSGERFDLYMRDHVFEPMGLTCGFNVGIMPEDVQKTVGTLYRKKDANDNYDPINGKWLAQVDDFSEGYPSDEKYDDYVIGTNGSLFGPMGSLRISVKELCAFMQMFCDGGSYNGKNILKPETIKEMFTARWNYDDQTKNGDTYYDLMRSYGMGPQIFTNKGGDRLVENQDLPFAGHTAEAYGLLGGMAFDIEKGNGVVYIVAGTGSDMDEYYGNYSSFYGWEENLLTAGAEFAKFDY